MRHQASKITQQTRAPGFARGRHRFNIYTRVKRPQSTGVESTVKLYLLQKERKKKKDMVTVCYSEQLSRLF